MLRNARIKAMMTAHFFKSSNHCSSDILPGRDFMIKEYTAVIKIVTYVQVNVETIDFSKCRVKDISY